MTFPQKLEPAVKSNKLYSLHKAQFQVPGSGYALSRRQKEALTRLHEHTRCLASLLAQK